MEISTSVQFPKIAIRFCVQCKWNLRAAYYAQELLQTFSNTLGEISLIPVTGGIFTIHLYKLRQTENQPTTESKGQLEQTSSSGAEIEEHLIWDRKRDGGFPETKELKGRVRDLVDENKEMGHIDRALKKGKSENASQAQTQTEETKTKTEAAERVAPVDAAGSAGIETAGTLEAAAPLDGDAGPGHASHQQHTISSATVADCAECMAALKEDEQQQQQLEHARPV